MGMQHIVKMWRATSAFFFNTDCIISWGISWGKDYTKLIKHLCPAAAGVMLKNTEYTLENSGNMSKSHCNSGNRNKSYSIKITLAKYKDLMQNVCNKI